LAGGAAFGIAAKVAYAGVSYFSLVLAARFLGADDFGRFALATTTIGVISTVAGFGSDNTLLRLLPPLLPDHPFQARRAVRAVWSLVAYTACTLTILLAALHRPFAGLLGSPELGGVLLVLLLSVPFAALLQVVRGASQASGAVVQSVLSTFTLQIVLQAIGFALLLLIAPEGRLVAAGWVFLGAWVLAALIATLWFSSRGPVGFGWLQPGPLPDQSTLRASRDYLFIQLLVNLKSSVVVLVIGRTLAPTDVGIYSAALRTASLVSFVLVGINLVFAPTISALWSRGEKAELERLYRLTVRWALALSIPACLALGFGAKAVLSAFDPAYARGAMALWLLALGQLINAATGSVGYLLMMTGHERVMLWNTVLATVVAGVGALIAAGAFGLVGAATIGGIAVGGLNLLLLRDVRSLLGLRPYDRATLRIATLGLFALIGGILLERVLASRFEPSVAGVATAFAAPVAFCLGLLGFGLRPDDRAQVARLLRRFFPTTERGS
jgi:O-antigen/teichoic acid export membrane protein